MAGQPGRSGGPRKNAGGARPGAGRPKKEKPPPPPPVVLTDTDMLPMLQNVARGKIEATALQVRAAIAAVQYTHTKKGDGGKKEEAQERAEQAASKFRRSAPPKLVAAGGQKV